MIRPPLIRQGEGLPLCALCQELITGNITIASDGNPVHEEHETDYEDNIYFLEFADEQENEE